MGYATGFRQFLRTTSFDTLELRSRWIILCTVSRWMPVSHVISRIDRCVFGLSSWLSTRSSTFLVFSLTHTERSLPLPGCRSIVPALRIFFNRVSILPHFEHLLWACLTDTWIERTYVYIKYCLTLFIHKTICCSRRNLSFFCSVISQGKVVALDRWGGKWNNLSMTHRLATDYAKNYWNRTVIVKDIV